MRLETGNGYIISEQAEVSGSSKYIGEYAAAAVMNALLAAGAECEPLEGRIGISARITVPACGCALGIYEVEKVIQTVCEKKGLRLLETEGVKSLLPGLPRVTVTGIAKAAGQKIREGGSRTEAGQDIVLTGWAGMEGMLRITEERKTELAGRFAPGFLKQICSYKPKIFAGEAAGIIREHEANIVRQITEGGILAALWNLSKDLQTGVCLDMKSISVLQETVEVCEHFRLNPYQLTSAGSFLVVTDRGEALADKLLKRGVRAAVIGRVTDSRDKIIYNGEEIRYIDRPAPDEIYRIFDM